MSKSPIRRGFAHGFVNYTKGCTRLAAASDKVYQLLAHGRWFSPGTPGSSTTKTGRHDIAEILLKVALNTKNQNQIYLFKINVANITERCKRQLKYSSHFTINKIDFRNCVWFFACCIIKVWCCVDIQCSYACQVIKYKIHIIHSFPRFDKREREDNKYIRWVNVYNYKHFHFMKNGCLNYLKIVYRERNKKSLISDFFLAHLAIGQVSFCHG